ncbi:SDR family NAD(P)-dependent oxidoreductase [Brachybacterium sp. JHP9]|uniref:SDR family NAD(P)-dependent oxidoreductase n=1 Tax=Brachybacterium equifaecis TaxID=2910770 RepID=A0ABT0QZS5_9MICO|nr:SDR family NAD(P)-dependent oxidoreductase [Brachybacterium equifaecis]MCL6422215.1 SDR family NAD(P)-dependent oxidoreductase [Brachybacterium equifaecis]
MSAMGWEHLHAPELTGRTVVMTGASDGLGREAALQLARWGADLVLPVRSRAKGERVRARIERETGRAGAVRLVDMDLSDLSAVRAGAETIRGILGRGGIDLLIHVAGAVSRSRTESADGFELMTAVNALAPFLLTELIRDMVRDRIVVVASDAHRWGRIDLPDPHYRQRRWTMPAAYGRSKLLTMLWGLDLAEQLRPAVEGGEGPDLQLVHPGWVLTNLQNASGSERADRAITALSRPLAMTAEEGAQSVLFAAAQPLPHGSYIGPDGVKALRGRPTLLRRSDAALDARAAREATAWMRREVGLDRMGGGMG